MPSILVVADDLTGAMDTAHGFAVRGHHVRVAIGADRIPEATVVAVNTNSRYAGPERAAETVRDVVAERSERMYKKIDSTLRGNVVAEVDAAVDASGADVALVTPAFPAAGRTTRSRIHRVDGTPVTETEYAADENGPTTADLLALLSASRYRTDHVGTDVVERGPDAIAATIGPDRPVLVACDAVTDDHLAAIARSDERIDGRVLFVGSGGLAAHVRVEPGGPEPDSDDDRDRGGRNDETGHENEAELEREAPVSVPGSAGRNVLGIVGSVNETTLSGLAAVPEDDLVPVDPEAAVDDPERAGRTAGETAAERLERGKRAVVTAAPTKAAVETALAAGSARGYEPAAVRARIARALATAARTAVESEQPAGLFVTGGDVAVIVFEALEATTLSLSPEAVEAGIPIGVVDDGVAGGVPVVTKAGGFGTSETVINCLRTLCS